MRKFLEILVWINIGIIVVFIFLYESSITNWRVIGPIIVCVCAIIANVCILIENYHETQITKKRLREITTEDIPWWKLKEHGGWL